MCVEYGTQRPNLGHFGPMMGVMASEITSLGIVYSIIYSGADQRKHQKLRITGLCVRNSLVTGEFPDQMASNAENVSIWWCHHVKIQVFSHFLKKFSLVSHQYCLWYSLQILLNVWRIWASEVQFLGNFGPKISTYSSLGSFYTKNTHWFRINLALHVNLTCV